MSKYVWPEAEDLTDKILHTSDVLYPDILLDIIDKKGRPKFIVNDTLSRIEMPADYPVYCVPLWIEGQAALFKNYGFPTEFQTSHVANFLINKKQINRHLLIKLVEWYNIDVDYTWSGIGTSYDMSPILDELDGIDSSSWLTQQARASLLSPIGLPPKWIEYSDQKKSNIAVTDYGGNYWTWVNGIDKVVSQSAISLISESLRFQKAALFSEKTMYSVLGLTFPLWVGGYGQADEWRKLGLDAFDDVIDHGYQYYDTLIERCWWAFALNIDLLTNKEKAANLRQLNATRLIENRDLFLHGHLAKQNDCTISTWPQEIQDAYVSVKNRWRSQR
jgi:hypothetical protein